MAEAPIDLDHSSDDSPKRLERVRNAVTTTNAGWVLLFRGLTALALYLAVRSEAVEGADYRFLAFFVSFISISQGIDFGLGGALAQLATRLPKHRESLRAIRGLVGRASTAFGGVSAVLVTALILLLPTSAIGLSGGHLYFTAASLGLSTGLNVRAAGFERTLIGLGYYRLTMTGSGAVAAFSGLMIFAIAWRSAVFPNLCIAMFAGAVLRQLVVYFCVHRVIKAVPNDDEAVVLKEFTMRELGRNSAIFFALQLIFFVSFQSDTLVANAFGGATTTREYATSLRFFVNIPGVVAVLCLPLWRSFAASVTQGDPSAAWQRFKHAERVVVLCSVLTAAAIAVVLLARPHTFIGADFPATTAIVWIAWVGVLSWGQIMAYLLASLNLLRYQLILSTAMMIANVAISIWATKVFGAVGPALGTLVSYSVVLALPARARARQLSLAA